MATSDGLSAEMSIVEEVTQSVRQPQSLASPIHLDYMLLFYKTARKIYSLQTWLGIIILLSSYAK